MDDCTNLVLEYESNPTVFENKLGYNEYIIYDEENYEIESLPLKTGRTKIVHIPLEYVCISDLYLVYKKSDFEFTINKYKDTCISLIIGGSQIYILSLFYIMIIANMIDKKIKEFDDEIKIPLVLFDLSKYNSSLGNKFPLFAMKYHEVSITIVDGFPITDARIEYRKYKLKQTHIRGISVYDISYELAMLDPQRGFTTQFNNEFLYNINMGNQYCPAKLLIIHDKENTNYLNPIEEIQLIHHNKTYTWNYDRGEIMKLKIFDKIAYIISLDPEYRSVKQLKNMVKKFNSWNKNNGIVFSKDDKITIKFATDNDPTNNYILIYEMRYNIGRFMSGMFGKAYG